MEYKAMAMAEGSLLRDHAGHGRHHLRLDVVQVHPLLLPARVLRLLPAVPPRHPALYELICKVAAGKGNPG